MKTSTSTLLLAGAAMIGSVAARDVPDNLKALIDSIKSQGQCNNALASGFYNEQDSGPDTVYCGDHYQDSNGGSLIYLQTGSGFSDMDTDCDGEENDPTGQCDYSNNPDAQGETSYGSMAHDNWGMDAGDLTSEIHSYAVFGNTNSNNVDGYATFEPSDYGIEPMSVMAVVCNNQLFYAVWADENGSDDGQQAMVGEGSLALANLCFPNDGLNYNNGHGGTDVFYLAFTGQDAQANSDVNWNTSDPNEFEESLASIGDKLVAAIAN